MNNKLTPLHIDTNGINLLNESGIDRVKLFVKLKGWIEESLDLFKNDLLPLLHPIFLHIYIDLIHGGDVETAKAFFGRFRGDFEGVRRSNVTYEPMSAFESISNDQHIYQNPIVNGFRTHKYYLVMSKYAYNLLINYIEENDMLYILKLMNTHMEIKVQTAANLNKSILGGIVDGPNDKPVDLTTNIVTVETESSVLNSEQYKYDHLETFVQQLKRQRKTENKVKAHPSLVEAEIEKLKDICKRVTVNKDYLPSICCYTVQNTYEKLTCAEISKDSKFIACGYSDSYIDIHSLDGNIRKLKTSEELREAENDDHYHLLGTNTIRLVGHSGPVYAISFSHAGKLLVSASADRTVRLWSLEMYECIGVYKAHVFPVWTVDFAPNDFYFASGGADKQCVVWCTKNTRPERVLLGSLSDVTVVKWHPNGNYIFAGSSDFKVKMYGLEDAQVVRTFVGHSEGITCMDVSCDGKLLVTGSRDKRIVLWDIESGQAVGVYVGHEGSVFSVSFSYYGTIICSSGSDNTVRLWDKSDIKKKKAESIPPIATYYTKNTPIMQSKFGYRNIVSCIGPFIS
ncbi:transcription initiation factor TFIID subunit TAF5 [Ecytonucleospora hepatopenaei]|uniref:Transcription initiation factor TFIID subunit TAF5 n=1 Tax=Ecytonucleospora hepatopenaei TaxID=646526 RepID=A0A1W0E7Z7_9MICR|nr:transcription initiation factor TFIID subunit TAF5 [Ecytonucleospora hepatopenaei]